MFMGSTRVPRVNLGVAPKLGKAIAKNQKCDGRGTARKHLEKRKRILPFAHNLAGRQIEPARRGCYPDYAMRSLLQSGFPYGKSSGTGQNSRIAFHNLEKSLFTSPDKQSVISPASSGYL